MIEVKNVSKRYKKKYALKSINLKLEPGKVYGVIGKNGAGKTTLFRCISGLEKFEGEILSQPAPLKDHCGLLLTQPYFIPKITGLEHLQLLLRARHSEVPAAEDLNIFDLPLQEYPENYSTGMKKKLALTAILFQPNEFFLLDEPFSGVDLESNLLIAAIIQKLKERKKTILLSSHLLQTVTELCDSIFILENGEIHDRFDRPDFENLQDRFISELDGFGAKLNKIG